MADQGQSALASMARSRAGAKPAPAGAGEEILAPLTRAAEDALGPLLSAKVKVAARAHAFASLKTRLSSRQDPDILYWLAGDSDPMAAMFVVDRGFAAVLTERLLGGDLVPISPGAAPSVLAFDMAAALVDVLAPAAVKAIDKALGPGRPSGLHARRGFRAKAEALRDAEHVEVFGVVLDLAYREHEASVAVELMFTRDYLEGLGVGGGAAEAEAPKFDPDWSARLRRGVLGCEIALDVILHRMATNVGALSRLSVGQVIELDPKALSALEIAAPTDAGPVCIARGRLGAVQAQKAVKLTTQIDPEFLRGL